MLSFCFVKGKSNILFYRYYCPPGQSEKAPEKYHCEVGHYCPNGSAEQRPCPINKMANYTHAVECDSCPAGFYCLKSGVPIECEKGFYCPAGTGKDLRPCPRGTYGPERQYNSVHDCKPCPAGKYCEQINATTYTGPCSVGHWCSYGVDRPKPIGSNTTLDGLLDSVNSTSCVDGRETGYGGMCPPGHYCVEGSDKPEPCGVGTYAPVYGMSSCNECMEGFYCPSTTMTDYKLYECPTGHYCPKNTSLANQYPCPAGTYSNVTGNTKIEDCKPCPPGRYCPIPGKCTTFVIP